MVYTPVVESDRTPRTSLSHNVTVDGRRYFSCCIPTLRNVALALAEHDQPHGPAVVVFDEADSMRPYVDVTEIHSASPALRLPRQQSDRWRARDLLAFAEARVAPTVVVWHEPSTTQAPSRLS